MQKYTVWMSGEDTPYSWNRSPKKFNNIEAGDFIAACIYVWVIILNSTKPCALTMQTGFWMCLGMFSLAFILIL